MSQSYVQLPTDGTGKKLATSQVTNLNGDQVHVEWTSDVPINPQVASLNVLLGGGASNTLNAPNIPSGNTGKMARWIISSALPVLCTLYVVDDANVATGKGAVFVQGLIPYNLDPAHRNYLSLSSTGAAHFRLVVQNLDGSNNNQVYTTLYYDLE